MESKEIIEELRRDIKEVEELQQRGLDNLDKRLNNLRNECRYHNNR
jgi:hypothetical protein